MHTPFRPLGLVTLALGFFGLLTGSAGAAGTPVTARTAAAMPLVRIAGPTEDQLVRTGRVRLTVATATGAQLKTAEVNGVDVRRTLHSGSRHRSTAMLTLSHGLRYGVNDVVVRTAGGGYDDVEFIVARRDGRLLAPVAVSNTTADAPIQATVRTAAATDTRAYVNGRRVDGAFSGVPGGYVGRLGANDQLRYGANRITILVHKTDASQRRSTYDVQDHTVHIPRTAPIASAGADRRARTGAAVHLDARATKTPSQSMRLTYRWRIVSAPKGSRSKLRQDGSSRPSLVADVPGTYRVRVTARGGVASSHDTVSVVAAADVPPIGRTFETMNRSRAMLLGGQPITGPECCHENVNYAVINRVTLQVERAGSVNADLEGLRSLGTIIDGYSRSQDDLVSLNWVDFDDQRPNLDAVRNELDNVLKRIGSTGLTAADRGKITAEGTPGSAIGIAGGAPGGAFVKLAYRTVPNTECPSGACDAWAPVGGMTGSLRKNGATGRYDFVFTDYVDVDSETEQTATNIFPALLSVGIGRDRIQSQSPGNGAGFHLVRLNAYTLQTQGNFVYRTNDASGAELTSDVQRLAADLQWSADQPDRPLVVLQAYGTPHGRSAAWDAAARTIERMGGTRQVFDAMNATDPSPQNGESATRKGPYAFIGRTGSTAPTAEVSTSVAGRTGRLRGLLMRARDGGFEPMLVGPARPDGQTAVNTEMTRIVNQSASAFPAFSADGKPIDAPHLQAIQNFLGGPEVTGLCSAAATNCDIRRAFYESYGASWSSIQDDLTNAERAKCPGTHVGFTAAECEAVRSELRDEVSMVAKVTTYLGPNGLQQPFGAASVSALADVGQISQEIKDAVNPPAADNTASRVLNGISIFLKLGGFAPPPAAQVAAGLSGVFAIAGYFTHSDGSPNLIGAQITTTASRLGPEIADRYQQAGDNLDDVGRIIVSDYGKLRTVAARANAAPGPGEVDWRLGSVGQARDTLRRATKQMIYERLVPLAYPVMYDLGPIGNARDWYCDGGIAYDKRLFNEQSDGAQILPRFMSDGYYRPLVAVGAAHAVGSLHSARIPGPPVAVTDALFKDTGNGGLGLSKLDFYAPRNGFRFFPAEPRKNPTMSGVDWTSLNMYPRSTGEVIRCSTIPNPPGNSG